MAPALLWLALQAPFTGVEVRGNLLVSTAAILQHAGFGDGLPAAGFSEAFHRLWATGLFEDVRFDTEPAAVGRRLVIQVREKPLLRDARIEGERLQEAELRDRLRDSGFPLEGNHPTGENEAREIARAAERLLGPEFAVRARLERVSDFQADLVLEVARKVWPRVESIRFEGNRFLSREELSREIHLRPKGLLAKMTRRDRYDAETMERDLDRLRKLYGRRGYARASVGPAEVLKDTEGLAIEIPIFEGASYRFGRLEVDPGTLLSLEDARAFLPASGAPYDGDALESVAEKLRSHYLALGYPSVRVDREETMAPGGAAIDVTFRVVEGPFLRVGFINFHGHRRHRDRDLRQFLELTESERLDPRAVDESVGALMGSGDFIAVTPEVDLEARPERADVDIRIEEKKAFEYLLGGGVNGTEGGTGAGELLARGLLGRSETLRLQVDLGNRFQNVTAGYRDLSTLGHRLFLAADFRRSLLDYPDETSEDTTDVALRAGGPFGSASQFLAGFRFSAFTLGSDLSEDVPFLTPFLGMRFETYRASLAFAHQIADRAIFPSKGRRLVFGYELVAGDVTVHRFSLDGTQLLGLDSDRRHVLAFSGRAAALLSFGETAESGIPRFERLFLGSENDLRGFPIRGVGPRDGPNNVGGDRLFFGSVEYRLSLSSRLRAVGFIDIGNVLSTDFEESESKALRYDAGMEAQILVPLANFPLRLGYGRNLDPLPDEPRGRFFLSVSLRF
jgi:outer membrane protein insertion porin family